MTTTRALLTTAGLALASSLGLTACSPSEADSQSAGSEQAASGTATPTGSAGEAVIVSSAAERPATAGAAENFTGAVSITPLFDPNADSTSGAGEVTFEPAARTAWHTHPAGQRLIVTAGTGWVQEWGGPRREVQAGDVVWFAPGVKHWHGATSAEAMTHIAVQDTIEGINADWQEHVTDAQYQDR